ncbi:SDR family oxidoreductase [Pseudonocardia sp. GCM10023141]|uniref:SDR family oxidoreductase n=1 Tax=Pseudonocardia sp. GCM10023141 TaxID=3252653 RepID=UPI003611E487
MPTLHGRTAIITGAGRGLGRAHALLFAELGAAVVVNDNGAGPDGRGDDGSNPAHEVVAQITAAGGRAVAHIGSVSDWNTAGDMVQLALDEFGGLDVLVNNAGILRDRTVVNMTEQDWDGVVDVHLKGHFCPLRHAANHWRAETKAGRAVHASVINTSSGSGLRGNPGQLNYAAAKAGIAAMTIVAAQELHRYGVRVNAIAPIARTRLTEQTPGIGELIKQVGEGFDVWAPENVSPLVAWLATAECHASGQVFGVGGGRVGLEQGWTETEVFERGERWTVDELHEALAGVPSAPRSFTSSLTKFDG